MQKFIVFVKKNLKINMLKVNNIKKLGPLSDKHAKGKKY